MTRPIQCFTCRHFEPWPSNPAQAVGWCKHPAKHGYHWAGERHRCADHDPKPENAHDATTEA